MLGRRSPDALRDGVGDDGHRELSFMCDLGAAGLQVGVTPESCAEKLFKCE